MKDTLELVHRYIAVWNERDAAQRRGAMRAAFTPDIVYTDPLAQVVGTDSLNRTIDAVQAQFPDLFFSLEGSVDARHDTARFGWRLGSPYGGEPLVIGFDVIGLREGKIDRVYGFHDKAPMVAARAG